MPSTAFSAQGTTLSIGSGTSGAKTITAISLSSPAIVTSAAHGLSNGDVVDIAAIVGTAGTDSANGLNGKSFVVANVTPNTFALVGTNTTGLAYTSGGTATPTTWTQINNVKSYSGFDGSTSVIDVSNLSSTAKEKRAGLPDSGSISFEFNPDYADAGQNALRAAKASALTKPFKLAYPNGKVASWSAFPTSISDQGGTDAVVAGSIKLEITGAVTVA